jgi:hypothetical protein
MFQVTVKYNVNEHRNPANPRIMTLEGVIPPDQKQSTSMNVFVLTHYTGKVQDMVFLVLSTEILDRKEIKAKFILSFNTVLKNPKFFESGSRWKATYVTSLITHQHQNV